MSNKTAPKKTAKPAESDEDLLGTKPAAKKAPAKKAAEAETKPAAKKAPAKKAAEAEDDLMGTAKPTKAPKAKKVKEPVTFEEGERDALLAKIPKMVKKPINSRDLAAKLEIHTRKLRPLLYSLERAELVKLESGESRLAGMTVSLP